MTATISHSIRAKAAGFLSRWWVVVAVCAVQCARYVRMLRLPEDRLIDHIPDDAFFYLQTARVFARTGRWSFDGFEPASGFHVLWGYLLAGLYRLDSGISLHMVFAVGGSLELVCVVVAAWLVTRTALRLFGRRGTLGVGIVLLSAISLSMGMCLMESSLVIVLSALAVDLLCRESLRAAPGRLVLFAVLGVVGMAARSDFGVTASAIFLVWLVREWRQREPRTASTWAGSRSAGALLAGAIVGALLLALHTHWISGNWVQSSVRQKLWWAHVQGFSVLPPINVLERFFYVATNSYFARYRVLQGSLLLSQIIPVVLLVGAALLAWRWRGRLQAWSLAAMFAVVALYIVFYRFNSADIQFWYIAPFQAPVALLSAGAVAWFLERWRVLTLAFVAGLIVVGVASSFKATYPFQRTYYQAGLYLRDHPELKPAASWNCGLVGYFASGGVTNLDGLVNDRILEHAQAGTLAHYVGERGIRTIVDTNIMFGPMMRRRGGFADGKLERCLIPEDHFAGNPDNIDEDERLFVYHVVPGCPGLR